MSPGARPRRHRTAADDAEFRAIIDAARDRHNLSDVVGRHTRLRRRGANELVGLCPFHRERTPSFEVNNAKGRFHCHGCGTSGDHFTILTKLDGMTFRQAYEALTGDAFPVVSAADRARALEEDAAARTAAIADARAVWDAAIPGAGTPAEVYAQSRGIHMPLPLSIRFARTWRWRDLETGEIGPDTPALIGAVTIGDHLVAVQRIFLRDGGRAKALGKRPKLSLGRVVGGALRLDAGVPAADEVIVTEGPEDALSLAQELPGRRVWAALGTAMIPQIKLDAGITSICIAGQNDAPGRLAVERAAAALTERGVAVRTMWPDPAFKDWNDQLRGVRM